MRLRQDDGPELHVAVDGAADGTVVVLLHGVMRSHRTWDWAVSAVGAHHRVVRPDARGHGDSARLPGGYTLGGYVSDAVAVIEAVASGPVVLVGHSLGGVTAAAVAQQRPDLVRGLLLEDPALALARPADGPPRGPLVDVFRLVREAVPALRAAGTEETDLARRLAATPTPFGVPAGERYTIDALASWAHGQLHLDESVLDPLIDPPADPGPAFDIDEGVAMRTVVLAADLRAPDRVTARGDEQRLTAASPRLRWLRVAGAGHNMHDEVDHRATVRDHLRGLLAVAG